MNDNYPSSTIDWTGQPSFKRRQRVRLLVAMIVMFIAFIGVTTLAYSLLASSTTDRAILPEDASSIETLTDPKKATSLRLLHDTE